LRRCRSKNQQQELHRCRSINRQWQWGHFLLYSFHHFLLGVYRVAVNSEIDNKNYVAADSKIDSESYFATDAEIDGENCVAANP
jgi:hypothetical protein